MSENRVDCFALKRRESIAKAIESWLSRKNVYSAKICKLFLGKALSNELKLDWLVNILLDRLTCLMKFALFVPLVFDKST